MTILPPPKKSRVLGPASPPDQIAIVAADAAQFVESFQNFRCRADDLRRVFARRPAYGRIAAQLMPMVQHLNERPAGVFADITRLKAEACAETDIDPSPGSACSTSRSSIH